MVGGDLILFLTKDGIVAVRASSGDVAWSVDGSYDRSVVMDDRNVYAVSALSTRRRAASAVDIASGSIVWRTMVSGTLKIRDLHEDALYLSDPDRLVALSTADGAQQWTFRSKTAVSAPPVAAGNRLIFPTATAAFFGAGSVNGRLYGIDASTGK